MKLQVQLPTGLWLYVTKVTNNDFYTSIYSTNSADSKKLPFVKVIRPELKYRLVP